MDITKTSELRETTGGYGKKLFWKLSLGDRNWNDVHPFDATDASIILSECSDCYHCGTESIKARKIMNGVVWFSDTKWECPEHFRASTLIAFSDDEYLSLVDHVGDLTLPPIENDEKQRLIEIQDWPIEESVLGVLPNLGRQREEEFFGRLRDCVFSKDSFLVFVRNRVSSNRFSILLDKKDDYEFEISLFHDEHSVFFQLPFFRKGLLVCCSKPNQMDVFPNLTS